MTEDEARKVAEVASGADGECVVCVGWLTDGLQVAFPEFDWWRIMAAIRTRPWVSREVSEQEILDEIESLQEAIPEDQLHRAG